MVIACFHQIYRKHIFLKHGTIMCLWLKKLSHIIINIILVIKACLSECGPRAPPQQASILPQCATRIQPTEVHIIPTPFDDHHIVTWWSLCFARLHKLQFVGITWNYSLNKICFCQPVVFLFCSPARHRRNWLWQLFLIQQHRRRISAPVRSANFLTMTWTEYWTVP